MSWSHLERNEHLKEMAKREFDLVIVGGGITGAGIARDAASRGMSVALVEAEDFAFGTSSRSSKLIHGGIRYLENFEFSLVFEALAERARLFKLAPHLVHPLRFLIPVYKKSRVPLWKMRLGMFLYDLLAMFETPKMHASLTPVEVRQKQLHLETRDLAGAVEYSDAYTDDDRLVIETLRDAHRRGALCVNYAKVLDGQWDGGRLRSLRVEDRLTGQQLTLKGRQFVSGVGPWTDLFASTLDNKWKKRLRPTKGVHLVFSRKKLPLDTAVVMAVEKRIIFVIPRHEMVIVGTTDTDYSRDPRLVTTEATDVEYLLAALNQYFPTLNLSSGDILSSYAGVRPLVDDGSETEGKTSREHSIFDHGPNLSFVAGGKYTTYRLISEEAVDFILHKMPFEERMSFAPSRTLEPLNPAVSAARYQLALQEVSAWAQAYSLPVAVVQYLAERHGAEAEVLLPWVASDFPGHSPQESVWMAEARFAIRETLCMSLTDFYWRRSPLFLARRDHGLKYLKAILHVFKTELNWSDQEVRRQEELLLSAMQHELSWRPNLSVS